MRRPDPAFATREDVWRWLARALHVFLAAAVLRGAVGGSLDLLANALVGLAVALVPNVIERRRGVAAPALAAWVAVAAAMHVAGMVFGLYGPATRYDDLTHAVSGSFVGAMAVVVVRLWERRIPELEIPSPLAVLVVLAVVMAGGVAWELIEFAVSGGGQAIQTSLTDTMSDLLFNLAGGILPWMLGRDALARTAETFAVDRSDRAAE